MNKIEQLEEIKKKIRKMIDELEDIYDELGRINFEFISCRIRIREDIKDAQSYLEDIIFELDLEIEKTKKYGVQ